MYERSAIVLERYFENLLEYRNSCNLKENFSNYCELVEKLEKYQECYQKEISATKEFNETLKKIKEIQVSQEKLYKKSAKLEYDRNLLFNSIDGKVAETKKCIERIEQEVEKNSEAMKKTKEKLIVALEEYNNRKFELSKSKRAKKIAEASYEETLEFSKANFEGINENTIVNARNFTNFDDTESIVLQLEKNGKGEKIPFNQEVIEEVTIFAVEIEKKIVAGYLYIYEKLSKLLEEIEEGAAKIVLHKKYLRNEKAKMDFLFAVKEYIIQFLDYERMTIIYGKKSHDKLMKEACENFKSDIIQINNLFELLVKETNNKATKKAYSELYNKSYLIDMQEKEEKFRKEKNSINLNTATLMNLNFWRINGIGQIYTIFYNNVSEVFGRDVVEFDLPKVDLEDGDLEDNMVVVDEKKEMVINNGDSTKKKKNAKTPFEIVSDYKEDEIFEENDEEYDQEYDNDLKNDYKKLEEEQFDIFGEKYKNTDFLEDSIKKERAEKFKINSSNNSISERNIESTQNDYLNDSEYDDIAEQIEKEIYEIEKEENLFDEIKAVKRQKKINTKKDEVEKEENIQNSILNKIGKIARSKKKTDLV